MQINKTPEEVLLNLIDQKIVSILKTLIKYENKALSLSEISKESNVPLATAYRILNKLSSLEIITTERIHKYKLFKLNKNLITNFLKELIKLTPPGLEEFLNELTKHDTIEVVLQQGLEQPNGINLIILGNIEPYIVKQIAQKVYNKYEYKIGYLVLTEDQFNQMRHMGLYSQAQKIIYKKNKENQELNQSDKQQNQSENEENLSSSELTPQPEVLEQEDNSENTDILSTNPKTLKNKLLKKF